MGAYTSNTNTSLLDRKFLKSLTVSTPLQNINNQQTQIHQIYCHSPQHHQIMLQKIRIKKNYNCPYLIKIIDSHTIESKTLCSSVIKTYLVIDKPQKLADEIEQRISYKMAFLEAQIWTLIYSCCIAAQFLIQNNVQLVRLNKNKIFIDINGNIKILDPDFSEGALLAERISQNQYIKSLNQVVKQIMDTKSVCYSSNLIQLTQIMNQKYTQLCDVQNYIKKNYLQTKNNNKQNMLALQGFSSAKKQKQKQRQNKSKSKQAIRVLSGRKNSSNRENSIYSLKSDIPSQTSAFTNYQNHCESIVSYSYSLRLDAENKQNKSKYITNNNVQNKSDSFFHRNAEFSVKQSPQLFTFKDMRKNNEPESSNVNQNRRQLQLDAHMFPKKALFGQRKKHSRYYQTKNPLSESYLNNLQQEREPRQSKQTMIVRSSQSNPFFIDAETSLDGIQLHNMISYQVDQQTSVREVCQQQSQYFLELMTQCKVGIKKMRG